MERDTYPEERFIASGLREERVPEAAARLSVRRLLELCDWHGVGPVLAGALERRPLPAPVREKILPPLKDLRRQTLLDNLLLIRELARFAGELQAAGVPFLLLKGAALLPLIYSGPEARPLADVDLLIQAADWPRARDHLHRTGRYRLPAAGRQRLRTRFHRKVDVATVARPGCTFELHWEMDIRDRTVVDIPALMARAVPLDLEGDGYRRPSDPDLALHAFLHLASHASFPRLIWVHDLALLARAGRIDWDRLSADAARARARASLHYSLTYLEKIYPGTAPSGLLARAPFGAFRRWMFRRAATPNPILPTVDLWRLHRRYAYALAFLDTPGMMVRFALGHAWRKVRARLPGT
ncbi:MAG: nucleotidyltransferase family protein [Acidobacteriota bacterium]